MEAKTKLWHFSYPRSRCCGHNILSIGFLLREIQCKWQGIQGKSVICLMLFFIIIHVCVSNLINIIDIFLNSDSIETLTHLDLFLRLPFVL